MLYSYIEIVLEVHRMSFILATDSNCDIPLQYAQKHNIYIFSVPVNVNGAEFEDDLGATYCHHEFYNKIREGAMPTTSQINVYTFYQQFERWVKEGKEVLYISFSSALSGIYNSAMSARVQLLEEYPNASITIVNSLCASGGQGLLVHMATQMKEDGMAIEEIVTCLEERKNRILHFAIVQDLNHLVRGGRVTPVAGFVGSLLQLKPILYLNEEGKLLPFQKVRGRKKAFRTLKDYFKEYVTEETDTVFVTHADCEEDAKGLAEYVKEQGIENVIISPLGSGVGSHTGADALTFCFLSSTKIPTKA